MLQKIFNFQNCTSAVEDLQDGEGKTIGKNLVIIDQDDGTVYRLTWDLNNAKVVGQRLLGIGGLDIVSSGNGKSAEQILEEARRITKDPNKRRH